MTTMRTLPEGIGPVLRTRTCLILAMAIAAPAAANIAYVDQSVDHPGDGTSWLNAFQDLQDALDAARDPANDITEIRIAAGTYRPDRDTADPNLRFELVSGVAIRGSFGGNLSSNPNKQDHALTPTILTGDLLENDGPSFTNRDDNTRTLITFTGEWGVDNPITLDALTIRGTVPDPQSEGAAMRLELANLTITNCTITDNLAGHKAAAYLKYCGPLTLNNLTVTNNQAGGFDADGCWVATANNCTFTNNTRSADNQSTRGGGLWVRNSRIVFSDTAITNNFADRGGGAAFISADVIFKNVKVHHNQATIRGAGIEIFSGETALLQSSIIGNQFQIAGDGAGVSLSNGIFDAVSTLWWANSAGPIETGGEGGALHTRPSFIEAHLINCVILENSANQGGAVYAQGPVTLTHSTLWSNHAQTVGGVYDDSGGTGPAVTASILWNNSDATGITDTAQLTTPRTTPATNSYIESWPANTNNNHADDPNLNIQSVSGLPFISLRSDSPCIDAANPDDLPRDAFDLNNNGEEYEPLPFDFAGTDRILGSAPDIGATESVPMLLSAADLNNDGTVNTADLSILLGAWGPCDPKSPCNADLNGDTAVNIADLSLLLIAWAP